MRPNILQSQGIALIVAVTSVAACSESSSTIATRSPNPGEIPPSTSVSGSQLTVGTRITKLRVQATQSSFRITTEPVTIAYYRECMNAGGCTSATAPTVQCSGVRFPDDPSHDQEAVTCVSAQQAAAYCSWQGAKLPTVNEFMLAARGDQPTRYSWGSSEPTCDQHANTKTATCSTPSLAVGSHQAGASPSGVQDVLMTEAELLRGTNDADYAACFGDEGFCLATGLGNGAIDAVVSMPVKVKSKEELMSAPRHGFRCVWEGQ